MKPRRVLVVAFLLSALWFVAAASQPREITVQVKECPIRGEPSFLSKPLGILNCADTAIWQEEQGFWWKVLAVRSNVTGWVHSSAFASCGVVLKSSDEKIDTKASSSETTIGAKSVFDSATERGFKGQHGELDYTAIDRLEQVKVPVNELVVFCKKGGLKCSGGAPQ